MSDLLRVPEVAERLALSESTIRRWLRIERLPLTRLGTGPWAPIRVDEDELGEWIAAQRTANNEEAP